MIDPQQGIPHDVLESLRREVESLVPDPAYPDDPFVIITIQEAFTAICEGNAGIGALLVDPEGNIVLQSRNKMFYPRFRSDFHAEMALLTEFEEQMQEGQTLRGYTLYSSLEPCEMCMIRIINSGVTTTYFASPDGPKGKTTRREEWAPHWRRLAEKQRFEPARCSPHFRDLAWRIFDTANPYIAAKLLARR